MYDLLFARINFVPNFPGIKIINGLILTVSTKIIREREDGVVAALMIVEFLLNQ